MLLNKHFDLTTQCHVLFMSMPHCMSWYFILGCRFSEWPADALKSVASRFLHDVDMDNQGTRNAVEDMCMVFHQTVSGAGEEHVHSTRPVHASSAALWLSLLRWH
jgi:hypothetical protein